MGIKKATTIAKAFMSELPVGQDWYENRIKICTDCEFNSDNVAEEDLSMIQRLRLNTGMNRFCTACQCDIDRKCSVKTEECGMVKLSPPQTPKWNRLEVESSSKDGVTVENESADKTKISLNGSEYLIDFGLTTDKTIDCKFTVRRKGGLKIISVEPACGCTVPTINAFNNKAATISVKISTVGFKKGINEKTLAIKYQDGNTIKSIHIRFRNIIS